MTPPWAPTRAPSPIVDVPDDADLPGEHHVIADPRRAGDADLRAEDASSRPISTLCAIMTRLSILRAAADPGHAGRGAVDRGVGADLDVVLDHHAADLRDLAVAAAVRRETEAVVADHGAGVDDDPIADLGLLADDHVRVEDAVGADRARAARR